MRDCSALVSSSQQCLLPQDPGDNKRLRGHVVGPLEAATLGKKQLRPWEAELDQRAGDLSTGVEVGKGEHCHTWWGNPCVGPQGFLQGHMGDFNYPREELFVADGVHFNQEGYDIYRDIYLRVLDDIL